MGDERRLICLDKLIEDLKTTKVTEYFPEWNEMTPLGKAVVFRTIRAYREVVLNQPTVDAVEVVRCRDCKWYQEGEVLAPNKFCFRLKHPEEDRKIGYNYAPDDFCSYGEKRCE